MGTRLYGSGWHGIALGLLSTFAGLAAAELVTGLIRGASSPVLPVGQEIIDIVPIEVKNWAIDTFGTADKAVLILGTVLSLAVVGSIVGVLAVRGARTAAYAIIAVVGAIGVYAVAMRPAPTFGKLLPPILGTLVSIAVIWWLSPRIAQPASVPVGDPDATSADPVGLDVPGPTTIELVPIAGATRRGFVVGGGLVAFGALVVGGLGRMLKRRFDVDDERAALAIPPADDTLSG